nr:hypothetical protein HmN_000959500 [Hymenolepis microstoma]
MTRKGDCVRPRRYFYLVLWIFESNRIMAFFILASFLMFDDCLVFRREMEFWVNVYCFMLKRELKNREDTVGTSSCRGPEVIAQYASFDVSFHFISNNSIGIRSTRWPYDLSGCAIKKAWVSVVMSIKLRLLRLPRDQGHRNIRYSRDCVNYSSPGVKKFDIWRVIERRVTSGISPLLSSEILRCLNFGLVSSLSSASVRSCIG